MPIFGTKPIMLLVYFNLAPTHGTSPTICITSTLRFALHQLVYRTEPFRLVCHGAILFRYSCHGVRRWRGHRNLCVRLRARASRKQRPSTLSEVYETTDCHHKAHLFFFLDWHKAHFLILGKTFAYRVKGSKGVTGPGFLPAFRMDLDVVLEMVEGV